MEETRTGWELFPSIAPPASAMCVDGGWKLRSEYEKTGKPINVRN